MVLHDCKYLKITKAHSDLSEEGEKVGNLEFIMYSLISEVSFLMKKLLI
jgi:hypothetical protein